MTTIQDVAKSARVSSATVSRVLNGSTAVSAKTREKVLACIHSAGYEPNYLGRNLRRSETRNILVLLPTIANPFYSDIVQGIETAAHLHGYDILIGETGFSLERENVFLAMLKNRLTDGIVFLSPNQDKDALESLGRRFPIVQCCESIEGAAVSRVSIDNEAAAAQAVAYLAGLGHREIAMISCRNGLLSNRQREAGFTRAMSEAGLPWQESFIVRTDDYTYDDGRKAAGILLKSEKRPTAVFCVSDELAAGALKHVEKAGLQVPGDLSLVGFDNNLLSVVCKPALTTVSQPQALLGKTALELLLCRIKDKQPASASVFLPHELIIRESTSTVKQKEA